MYALLKFIKHFKIEMYLHDISNTNRYIICQRITQFKDIHERLSVVRRGPLPRLQRPQTPIELGRHTGLSRLLFGSGLHCLVLSLLFPKQSPECALGVCSYSLDEEIVEGVKRTVREGKRGKKEKTASPQVPADLMKVSHPEV